MYKLRCGIFAWVRGVEAFLVSQNDQRIRLHQVRYQSTQGVVVTELDLVVDHRVVFVDDGHHAQLQQGEQGGTGIEIPLPIGQVSVGQQHLGAAQAIGTQFGFVHLGQAHLPHRGSGLQFMHFFGTDRPAQAFHAFCNRAAGDHDDFATIANQMGKLATPLADGLLIQPTAFVGHQTRPYFDHHTPRIAQYRGAELLSHFGL